MQPKSPRDGNVKVGGGGGGAISGFRMKGDTYACLGNRANLFNFFIKK